MSRSKHWHFIGIGGIGMSGLARILLQRKEKVSGSDLKSNRVVQELAQAGAAVHLEQKAENIQADMSIVYSTAVKSDNPEFQTAQALGCPTMHRSELLQELTQGFKTLAVAGTHGKTTTSALLAHVLVEAGCDPAFAVGGILAKQGCNAQFGQGDYFVVEADESDGSFLNYQPYGAIITNLEDEHMDHYGSSEKLQNDFRSFLNNVQQKEYCLHCADDLGLQALSPKGLSYGFSAGAKLQGSKFYQQGWKVFFDVSLDGCTYSQVEVPLPGRHNALNALAVFGLCIRLGLPEDAIRKGLLSFQGIGRRCQKIGEKNHILILDDYAHHPTEIRSTLQAIRKAVGQRRIIAVHQPHRYTRTKECQGMYKEVFREADEVIITDIYPAGEAPIPGVSAQNIVKEIQTASWPPSRFASGGGVMESLSSLISPHDVLVTMGAGDVNGIAEELMEEIEQGLPERLTVGVIFGGRSLEHEISVASARHICDILGEEDYDVKQFGVTRDGEWVHGPDVVDFLGVHEEITEGGEGNEKISPKVLSELMKCDVVFPVFHGPFGEDGMVQGFLETLGLAYVGSDYRAASLCTDKAIVKRVMMTHRVNTAPFVSFSYTEWARDREELILQIAEKLVFPLFVKPAHYGSSIGIHKVDSLTDLPEIVERALYYDTHVLVEEGVIGREFEFAVLGNDWLHVPPPAEIIVEGQVYDYRAKYRQGGVRTDVQATLPHDILDRGQHFAAECFRTAGCAGMATISAFLDEEGEFWFNEIDPTPGFTAVSLFSQIWESNGLNDRDLLSQLLVLAVHRRRWQERVFSRTLGRNKPRYDEHL